MPPPLNRNAVLGRTDLRGRAFTTEYTRVVEEWLCALYDEHFAGRSGVALVATGGQGRYELAPFSDLDLLLLHDGSLGADESQALWYPMWDAKLKVGHSVRTIAESLALSATDIATATSLLSSRHVAGDESLTNRLIEVHRADWRKRAKSVLAELAEVVDRRHTDTGSVANALEPDLKEGRGGLRDVHALGWIMATDHGIEVSSPEDLEAEYDVLLNVRVELHRMSTRAGDVVRIPDQDALADALGDPDSMHMMTELADAARRIAWASDDAWYHVRRWLRSGLRQRFERPKALGGGYELRDGFVALAPSAPAEVDPMEPLAVALAAAQHRVRIHREVLDRLADAPQLSEPWPEEARRRFIDLLLCGASAIEAIESLDLADRWVALIPEWAPIQSRPQRNAYHRFTVDRHSWECVALAAGLADTVDRSDLLVIAALLHDIGKGYPGEHSIVGIDLSASVMRRMGWSEAEIRTVGVLVEHHLLLADVATRRDLDDPVTISMVAARVETAERLELLAALTEADSIATGPSAWSPWKAGLVADLVKKTEHVLGGGDAAAVTANNELSATQQHLVERQRTEGRTLVEASGKRVTIVCADRPGVFSRIAGVLALNGLDVLDASVHSTDGKAVEEFLVEPAFSSEIPWPKVANDIDRALLGRIALEPRLAERQRSYRSRITAATSLDPNVRVLEGQASDGATVVEVIGRDRIGLLHALTKTMSDLDLDILRAKIATLGGDVVDTFYVRSRDDQPITHDDAKEIRSALLFVLQRPEA